MDYKKSLKRWRIFSAICLCCSFTFILLAIILPPIFINLIKDEAAKGAIMSRDTYELWGQVPGETNSFLKRDFTFYNFRNPYDVMFRNKTPIFVEDGPYTFQEFQNFTDPQYFDDDNIVSYRCWVNTRGDKDADVSFANFIAIGAWYQMKHTERPSMALQAFGAFYFELENFIYLTMLASTIRPTFLTEDSAKQTFLKNMPIDKQNFIWFDEQFGMENITSFINWVQVTQNGIQSGSAQSLRNYFIISYIEMLNIIESILPMIDGASNILNAYYCSTTPTKKCSPQFLSALQWVEQGITINAPPGVDPTPSVITGNSSGHGYPELSYFYNEYFLVNIDSSEEYKNIKFDVNWGMKVLSHYPNYSIQDPQFYTDPHLILHIGNLRFLYEQGLNYDKTQDINYLNSIKDRFLLDTYQQARVFWEYIKYFEEEFAVQKSINGTMEVAAMGTVISQSLFGEMMLLQEKLLLTLLTELLYQEIQDCSYVVDHIDDLSDDQKQLFCNRDEFKTWNKQSIVHLIQLCENIEGEYFQDIVNQCKLDDYQLLQVCDWDEEGFGIHLGKTHKLLKQLYKCEREQCTNYELSIRQWAWSEVSLNPPNQLFQASHSINEVYPHLFPHKFEYHWFHEEFKDVVKQYELSYEEVRYLLSFDCLYNGVMVQNAFIYYINNDLQSFKRWMLFDSFKQLHYFRYIMVSIGLDGLADKRTIQELLFGYWPTIVDAIKTMDPAMGGDPSSPIAGLNINIPEPQSQRQAMYTGKNDTSLVRIYSSVDSLPYLTIRLPYFDGNISQTRVVNPWNIEEKCNLGTDAFSFSPGMEEGGQIIVIIADLLRAFRLDYNSTVDFHGLTAYKYIFSPIDMKVNEDYHNYKFDGLINFTTAQNAPIINSLRHFRNGDPKLQEMVEVFKDYKLTDRQWDSDWDDSYVILEPLTGVALSALLNLQINVEYESDILFPGNQYAILPILNLWRGANWTAEQIDITFGELKLGLKLRIAIMITGYCAGFIFILISGFSYYFKVHKKLKQKIEEADLSLIQEK